MLNIIKMDLYRMLKTKSMYVIWIVLAAILLITTSLCKTDYELLTEKDAMKQEQVTEPTVDNLNVGMMVTLPTEPGKKVTVYDIFFANSQGKLYALLLVIFTVLFSTADISSGYIKNIGGQVRNRGTLIFSRAIALAVFTVLTMAGAFLFQAAANGIVFGELEWGNTKAILSYFVTELALHYALVLICMAIAIILKNNVISMVIAVCLTVIVLVLFLISITGIVTIKTIGSIRYFGIMYICGMNYTKAQFMTILEMTFNSVLAFAFTTNLLALQKKFKLVGKINCNIGMLQMLFMLSVCIIIVLWSGQTTKNVLKGNTPIEIIKNME